MRLGQRARHGRNPADLAGQRLGLVHAHDGHGALFAGAVHVEHGGAEENLIAVGLRGGIHHFGDIQALGQEAHAPVDFAQALLAVQVIAILGAVAVGRRPRHHLHDGRTLDVHQVRQLIAQARVALRRHVVARAGRQRLRLGQVVLVVAVGFFDKCFVHALPAA
ncbi:Uncharacterised protein [Bordetella pertussis]|nr:Uncharacterised protein [Bordetella pertussis]